MAYNQITDNRTAERIFVCGALNALLHSGSLSLAAIEAAVIHLRQVWTATFGADAFVEGAIEALPKKDAQEIYTKLQAEIDGMRSHQTVSLWWDKNTKRILTLPEDWRGYLRTRAQEKMLDLKNQHEQEKANG